ncbi:MAG: hypothetical protein IJX08_03575 [Clostridia bacterium]|nr:hypothetical protein [Clostridia bacterium]
MAGYSRMIIMSMSEEEIREVLSKQSDTLPDHTVSMMIEELKKRAEMAEEEEQTADETSDALAKEQLPEEDLSKEDAEWDDEEENADAEEQEEEALDEELSDEEREAKRLEKQIKALEMEQKDRKKTLILACVGTAVAALAIVGFMVYLAVSGQL